MKLEIQWNLTNITRTFSNKPLFKDWLRWEMPKWQVKRKLFGQKNRQTALF